MSSLIFVDNIEIIAPQRLSQADASVWDQLTRQHERYAVPSLRPEFTQLVAKCRPNVQLAVFQYRQQTVGFFSYVKNSLGQALPPGQWLMSFQGPVLDPCYTVNPRQWLEAIGARQMHFDRFVSPHSRWAAQALLTAPSPIVNLSRGYESYCGDLRSRGSRLVKRLEQKRRSAGREFGCVKLADESRDENSLQQLIAWRRNRNREILATDFLAVPWTNRFLQVYTQYQNENFRGRLFVLRFGGRPVAALSGIQFGSTLECVVTAFDPDFGKQSPGLLLFHILCRDAANYGIERIHLTRGIDKYKERFENESCLVSDMIVGQSWMTRLLTKQAFALQEAIRETPLGLPAQRMLRRMRLVRNRLQTGSPTDDTWPSSEDGE